MLRVTTHHSAVSPLEYFEESLVPKDLSALYKPEEPALWFGKLAERLGLKGQVTREDFAAMLANVNPQTGESLTPRTREDRRSATECGLSAPKSLSVMWTMDPRLLGAFVEAGREIMGVVEDKVQVRVRKDGADTDRPSGEAAWAEIIHTTARPVDGIADPHVHGHWEFMNAAWDPVEGRIKAAQLGDVHWDKPLLEAQFSSLLAEKVTKLGYTVVVKGRFWEIEGIPESVIEKFSRRTDQIEAVAAERGITEPWELDRLGAKVRERKSPEVGRAELQGLWASRLTAEEHAAILAVKDRADAKREGTSAREDPGVSAAPETDEVERERELAPLPPADRRKVEEAVREAAGKLFERSAVVPERTILDAGLRAAPGKAKLGHVRAAMEEQGIITRVLDGKFMATTAEAIGDEQTLVSVVAIGKGRFASTANTSPDVHRGLTAGQAEAVAAVLGSPDLVTVIRGRAGVGKTVLTRVGVQEIMAKLSMPVCMLAPTSQASRGVLRKEGHKSADTVAKFLVNQKLQDRARNGVIWVDEAGLLGVKDCIKLLDKAFTLGARVVLMGDDKQHRSVARGTVLETLDRHANARMVTVDGVLRQKGAYKAVVDALIRGDAKEAIQGLDAMKAIQVCAKKDVFRKAAADYVETRRRGDDVVLIAPTHAEGRAITDEVRRMLRDGGELKKGVQYQTLTTRGLTRFERGEAKSYRPGDIVQFFGRYSTITGGTFDAGSRWRVLGQDPFGNVLVKGRYQLLALPLKAADKWEVYEQRSIELAAGDRIRVTNNGRVHSRLDSVLKGLVPSRAKPSHEVLSGGTYTLKRVSPKGDLTLDNGLLLSRDFAHLTHGYCLTSVAAQGTSPDRVIGVITKAAGEAASSRGFYVTVTRGKKSVRLYTDDRDHLVSAAMKQEGEASAIGLMERGVDVKTHADQKLGARIFQQRMEERAREAEERRAEAERHRGRAI